MSKMTSVIVELENFKMKEQDRLAKQRVRSRRSYTNRFKILPDMTVEEKLQVQRNIQRRRDSARARYVGQVKEKQQQRAKKRYVKKEKEVTG